MNIDGTAKSPPIGIHARENAQEGTLPGTVIPIIEQIFSAFRHDTVTPFIYCVLHQVLPKLDSDKQWSMHTTNAMEMSSMITD